MGGGIKDMLSPPCQNMGGIHHSHPPHPLRIYALGNHPIKNIYLFSVVIFTNMGCNACVNACIDEFGGLYNKPTIKFLSIFSDFLSTSTKTELVSSPITSSKG